MNNIKSESLSQERWIIKNDLKTNGTLKYMLFLASEVSYLVIEFNMPHHNIQQVLIMEKLLGNTDQTFYTFWTTHKQISLTHL